MKTIYLIIILLVSSITRIAYSQDLSCEKWQVQDITFEASDPVDKPFDASFGAYLRHSGGATMKIPGFYNDDNSWILRVCLAEEGEWTYMTYSSVPSLDQKTGSILVGPNTKADRHGAIKIDPDKPQRFVYEDGSLYFPMAFEIDWLFALDAENTEDIPRTRQIVKDLSDFGLNKLIMNVYAYDAGWGERDKIDPKYNFSQPAVFPFGGSNSEPDHSTLNIDFFKHLDRVMQHLHSEEMVSHLMIYVWNKKVNWATPGSEEDNRYYDYVIKRYQAFPNLLWDISKEALAYGMDDMSYIAERIGRLKKLDGHGRLVTVHDYSFCNAYPGLVDFISIQEWVPNLYDRMLKAADIHSTKPIFNVEHGGYEKSMHSIFNGAYIDAEVCLERSYTCLFAGTYTSYYWQNTSWYELVYEPFALPEENQPHFDYYKHLTDFFAGYNFNELVPEQYLYSPYCLTDKKNTCLFLVASGLDALEGMAPKHMDGRQVEVQWYNPLTGEYVHKEERKLSGWMGFRKPADVDCPFYIAVMQVVE